MRRISLLALGAALIGGVLAPAISSQSRDVSASTRAEDGLAIAAFDTLNGTVEVNLPDDLSAGDTISGTVTATPAGKNPKEIAENQGQLDGMVVELADTRTGTPQKQGTWKIPAGALSSIPLILRDKKGKELARTTVPLGNPAPTPSCSQPVRLSAASPSTDPACQFATPSQGQAGHPVSVKGPFDGDFGSTIVSIGGQLARPLAESPRKTIAMAPQGVTGVAEIAVVKRGETVAHGTFRAVGIRLSAGKLSLLRGEQTQMTITVTGLEGITVPVGVSLVNKSPSVVSVEGGASQQFSIGPADAGGGTYVKSRTLTGIRPGGFAISATVDAPSQTAGAMAAGTWSPAGSPGMSSPPSGSAPSGSSGSPPMASSSDNAPVAAPVPVRIDFAGSRAMPAPTTAVAASTGPAVRFDFEGSRPMPATPGTTAASTGPAIRIDFAGTRPRP